MRVRPSSLVLAAILTIVVGVLPAGSSITRAQSGEGAAEVNVEIILDSSGSMGQLIGSETRMQIAKRVLKQVVAAIPEREGVNVGFRIYGHEGDNTAAGRAESCRSSELMVPIDGVDKPALVREVDLARPTGWIHNIIEIH